MKQSAWLGIGVGTLISSIGLWLGILAVPSSLVTGLAVISVSVVFAMYAMAAFSGVEDAATVAFHSSLYGVVAASTMVVIFVSNGSLSYLFAAPVVAIGVGGAIGLPPVGNRSRTLSRVAAVGLVAFVAVGAFWVDRTVYALIAPLLPLPAVGLADKMFDRAVNVIAEEPDQR